MFGKSTISKKIAENSKKSALIEGDDIYHQVVGGYISPWKEGNHLDIFWEVSLDTILHYLKEGYDVIFNYIISPKNLEKIKEKFKDYKIKFTVLLVDEETILKRDKERPLDCQMKERCLVLLNNFKNHNYNEKYIIDTSNITVDDTLKTILNEDRFII